MQQMKRILAICNTPFQVIVVARLREIYYANDHFDVLMSDQMVGYQDLVQHAEETLFFTSVQGIQTKAFVFEKRHNDGLTRVRNVLGFVKREKILRAYYGGSLHYDEILAFNIDRFTELLFECIVHHVPDVSVSLFEEGAPCYQHFSIAYTSSRDRRMNRSLAGKIVDICLNRHYIFQAMKRVYAFIPEMLKDTFPFEMIRIPPLRVNESHFNNLLFHIFSYNEEQDAYDAKVVVFEECFNQDREVMDYGTLLRSFVHAVGKNNIIVKKHPRSQSTYFENEHFRVNSTQSIPWELIVLKHPELSNIVWASLCSGSMICPYYYENLHYQCVSLIGIAQIAATPKQEEYFRFVKEKLLDPHPEVFFQPSSEEQLLAWLNDRFSEKE